MAITALVPTISARYMWLWTMSGRMSARWAARIPVAIASSGSSITVTGMSWRWSLRTALPGDSETTDTSYRSRSIRETRLNTCSCAPPLVPVAMTWTTRIRSGFGRVGRGSGVRQGSQSGSEVIELLFVG